MKRVCIIQRVAVDYRKPFFLLLERILAARSIALTVAAGAPWPGEGLVDVLDEVPFGIRCRNRKVFGNVYWTNGVLRASRNADLVVFEQSNAALHLYPIIIRRCLHKTRRRSLMAARGEQADVPPMAAFWGHGAHLNKAKAQPIRDKWKKFLATRVDWWFAYTDLSADIVKRLGFPAEKITTVNNAVDTDSLRAARVPVSDDELLSLRRELFREDIGAMRRTCRAKPPTGVFCARLVPLKWIPFLLRAIGRIRELVPDFTMVIVGDGPERAAVRDFCHRNRWCAWVGARHGPERVPFLALGDVFLNPGMLGLAVLDAFALGLPVFSTDNRIHSPEIFYLKHGLNGLLSAPDPDAYAQDVAAVIRDPVRLSTLKERASADGKRYTVEAMAKRFAEGVDACLNHCEA
ncbi:MAG: glycosyltransferase family 4 protein [Kiritimatiellae bacterium]|nr:glycosyltransferase family 4 protein [Kiritimatiellia bacterium]